ncbi:MAG: conjugal transfer protein TraF [Epsilonproteobacteria bacterium]|nr:conjugal transfer protein TraF [Campylobacterota bacterium]
MKKTLLSLSFLSASLAAMPFLTLGYKSVSMGGACVASSANSLAVYNNPALLAKNKDQWEFSAGGGISTYDHGASAPIQRLDDIDFLDTIDKASNDIQALTPQEKRTLIEGKNIVLGMNNDAVDINPQGYFGAKINNLGFGIFGYSDGAAIAKVNQAYDQLIFEYDGQYYKLNDNGTYQASNAIEYQTRSMQYALEEGLTYLEVKGIALYEVPIGYAHNFELSGGQLLVGGSIKYMYGVSYVEKYKIDNSDTLSGDDSEKDTSSSNFSFDLGIAYIPSFAKQLTIGIVAKNLTSPSFDTVSGDDIKIDPLIRIGIAYNILDSLEFALDYDITSNATVVPDADYQVIGGGLNWQATDWFSLRGGLMQNLDTEDKAGIVYTAGLGIGFPKFSLDVSGCYSSNQSTLDSTEVPTYAKINVALVSKW